MLVMTSGIPPRPPLDQPPAGSRAELYREYETGFLIDLIRSMLPGPEADEDEVVAKAHAKGEASHVDLLVALHERGSREVFEAARALCRHESPQERILGLMILRDLGPAGSRPLFEEAWPLLEDLAKNEGDPAVLYWVLGCLRYTCSPRVIDTLVRYSTHADPDIRRGIAFGIAGCGPADPRVIEVQLRLAEDPEVAVRAYAVYDFVNDIQDDTPEIRAMLTRRLDDTDPDIRLDAKAALQVRDFR
jgi:HEAT repeat protein